MSALKEQEATRLEIVEPEEKSMVLRERPGLFATAGFDETLSMATVLSKSGLFSRYKSPEQALVAVLAGREMGLGPVASLRGVYVIADQIAISYTVAGALIKASGKYDYSIIETSHTRCVIEFYERRKPIGKWSLTIEEAIQAGFTRVWKDGGYKDKPLWKQQPNVMLIARCITAGQRAYCPDVTMGSIYVPEELEDVAEFVPGANVEIAGASVPVRAGKPPAESSDRQNAAIRKAITATINKLKADENTKWQAAEAWAAFAKERGWEKGANTTVAEVPAEDLKTILGKLAGIKPLAKEEPKAEPAVDIESKVVEEPKKPCSVTAGCLGETGHSGGCFVPPPQGPDEKEKAAVNESRERLLKEAREHIKPAEKPPAPAELSGDAKRLKVAIDAQVARKADPANVATSKLFINPKAVLAFVTQYCVDQGLFDRPDATIEKLSQFPAVRIPELIAVVELASLVKRATAPEGSDHDTKMKFFFADAESALIWMTMGTPLQKLERITQIPPESVQGIFEELKSETSALALL